jgi:hypothetical protein
MERMRPVQELYGAASFGLPRLAFGESRHDVINVGRTTFDTLCWRSRYCLDVLMIKCRTEVDEHAEAQRHAP